MTKKDSPWKATATTDPSAVGAAVTRTLALQLAGQLGSKQVVFPGVLVTQSFLLKEQIKNMDDLRAKLPDLNLAKVASAAWIRVDHVLTSAAPARSKAGRVSRAFGCQRWNVSRVPRPVRLRPLRPACPAVSY